MNAVSVQSQTQKTVFQAKFFSVVEKKININKLQQQTYHNVLRSPIVSIFPMTDTYDLYLISQYRYLYNNELLEEIAGHVDSGETSLNAAKRELSEEVGIKAGKWKRITTMYSSASVVESKISIYLARDLTFGKAHPEEDEQIRLLKMPLQSAVLAVMNGKMQTSVSMLGILMLDEMRRKGQI